MSFKEHLKELENKNYKISENVIDGVLVSYDVTYSYAGKSLTESVNVVNLSKKTSGKKLEDVKKKLKEKVITESTAQMGNPGTDIIQNDYARTIFPYAFTVDCTTLSPKEISDAVLTVSLANPQYIKIFIDQAQDALATFEKLGQKNRVDDLKIRLEICKQALENADKLGKFSKA